MYNYKRNVKMPYENAVAKVRESLKKEGFGIITEIDVQQTLKNKLNVDFDKYIILGACNPSLAHQALLAERDLGLLLPCNVIVYQLKGETFVASILPTVQLGKVGNILLDPIAKQVEVKLKTAIEGV